MKDSAPPPDRSRKFHPSLLLFAALVIFAFGGCRHGKHTSNPRLRQIDDMLDSQLHPGATKARVIVYLHSQGFEIADSMEPHTVVAIVRHVDTGTLQPETARVTFHFDKNDKLLTYELVPASGPLLQR